MKGAYCCVYKKYNIFNYKGRKNNIYNFRAKNSKKEDFQLNNKIPLPNNSIPNYYFNPFSNYNQPIYDTYHFK